VGERSNHVGNYGLLQRAAGRTISIVFGSTIRTLLVSLDTRGTLDSDHFTFYTLLHFDLGSKQLEEPLCRKP
jgi:hypothetical protein